MNHPAVYTKHALRADAKPHAGRTSILKALAYFDIFYYPLTRDEIRQYLDRPLREEEFQHALSSLLADKLIFYHHDFYGLQDNPLLALRRKAGNERARLLLKKARKVGAFLQHFPFVRAVGISGSLSKDFAGEKTDFDFFIITRANRLWIARTLMHLFKKLSFLAGRQHYFCMNYYVDEQALTLEEKNIFAAIELKTLVPVAGNSMIQRLAESNAWADRLLPCCGGRPALQPDRGDSLLKRWAEWCFSGPAGEWLDNFFQRITVRRWARKEARGSRNQKGLPMGLITGKHFARSNPGDFQEKVLASYAKKLEELQVELNR